MKKIILFTILFPIIGLVSCASLDVSNAETSLQSKTHSIRGTVVEASMNTITIMTKQGKTHLFSIADAKKQFSNGLKLGNSVIITYKGDIQGLDTSNVQVVSVSDYSNW